MSINSKNKGSAWEREVCKIFKRQWPGKDFMRVPSSGALMGKSNKERHSVIDENVKEVLSGDIICPPNFRFSVECKCYAGISFWDLFNESSDLNSWIKQCSEDAAFANKLPMLIIKINQHKPIVGINMTIDDFEVDNHAFEHRGFFFYPLEQLLGCDEALFFEEK